MRSGSSGAERNAREQVEGGKAESAGTGGGGRRNWKFFHVGR